MIRKKNLVYIGSKNRESVLDIEIPTHFNGFLILFVHGYKGYKDWGAWNLVQKYFVEQNFGFSKINLSHNGCSVENPSDFVDLDAFGNNCYSYEVNDVKFALNKTNDFLKNRNIGVKKVIFIGHSRGGGDVILASRYANMVCTWAGISDIDMRFPKEDSKEHKEWKDKGVRYVLNGRTRQKMPHFYSMMDDYLKNKLSLSIKTKCKNANIPMLHIHGKNDKAVSVEEAFNLQKWSRGKLEILEEGNHVFGAKEPWENNFIPYELLEVCKITIGFIRDNL